MKTEEDKKLGEFQEKFNEEVKKLMRFLKSMQAAKKVSEFYLVINFS